MRRKINCFCILLTVAAMLILLPFSSMAEEEEGVNLIENGSFEKVNQDGMPDKWTTDAYIHQEGYTMYSISDDAHEGGKSASIHNIGMNDARFSQTVHVKPGTCYLLSGYVKADAAEGEGRGANLSIEGIYAFSDSVYNSGNQWVYTEIYGQTGPNQNEVTVFARLGGYSGESIGTAYFDDLRLEEVDSVPEDMPLYYWYPLSGDSYDNDEDSAAEASENSFRKQLYISAAAYILIFLVLVMAVSGKEKWSRKKTGLTVSVMLIAAYIFRIVTALCVEGYQVDVNCFVSWSNTMGSVGPAQFYQSAGFCDYTPGYLYALWLANAVGRLLPGVPYTLVIKQIPILCDVLAALLVYKIADEEKLSSAYSCLIAALVAFSPAAALNSAAWCQIDSVLSLGIMLVAYMAVRKKWQWVFPLFMLCVLIKPQALMLGFLGLAAIVLEAVQHRESRKKMLAGVGLTVVLSALIVIPFSVNQENPEWLIDLYKSTLGSYSYATVNSANLCYLLCGNWVQIDGKANVLYGIIMAAVSVFYSVLIYVRRRNSSLQSPSQCRIVLPMGEPIIGCGFAAAFILEVLFRMSWNVVGWTSIAFAFAITIPSYLREGNVKKLPLCGAVLFILIYVLGTKMHERYIFPGLFLLAMAYCFSSDKRILAVLSVMTCTTFVNEGIVLDNSIALGASMGHLNSDTLAMNNTLSALNVACAVFSVYLLDAKNSGKHHIKRLKLRHYESPQEFSHEEENPSLGWNKVDTILVAAVTLVYSAVALWNLGSVKAPQSQWKSSSADEQIVLDLGEVQHDFSAAYFCGVSYEDFSFAVSDDGENWSEEHYAQMDQGLCYRWMYLSPCQTLSAGERSYSGGTNYDNIERLSGRYVRITSQQIGLCLNEVIFKSSDGKVLPVNVIGRYNGFEDSPNYSSPSAVIDEQDTMVGELGWYNGTYFDEIYHARTAKEMLDSTVPYETTHPPLGKILMSLGIAVFGMTPFGWRISGAVVGIIMVPVMYALAKQLLRRRDVAFAAMTMLALDCMHLTQTRIATIDSYPVLFIMLSYLFMLRFMQTDFIHAPMKKVLPSLALSGLFMGCGIASKWIGCYSAVGLALLFAWTCFRKYSASCRKEGEEAEKSVFSRILHICLWCLLFFIAVPIAIYLASYIPHLSYAKADSFGKFITLVINAQKSMFSYHSTPGLGMDHPFYSPWYEWPIIKRPMYYSMAQFVPAGYSYSIFCFGNPAVWYAGIVGIIWTVFMWVRNHCYSIGESEGLVHLHSSSSSIIPSFILIGLLSQFLPWVLVPRGTYIYHYFASVPFIILGTAFLLSCLREKFPRIGKWTVVVYLVLCLVMFVGFYPYASGTLTRVGWLDFMKKFLTVYHA